MILRYPLCTSTSSIVVLDLTLIRQLNNNLIENYQLQRNALKINIHKGFRKKCVSAHYIHKGSCDSSRYFTWGVKHFKREILRTFVMKSYALALAPLKIEHSGSAFTWNTEHYDTQ